MPRANINLKQSICTENPTGTDIYAFGDAAAQHVENTGIEREGGLTTQYEQETTFTTPGASMVDRGDCESSTPPAVNGETANFKSNATFDISTTQHHGGSSSYKF